MSVVVCGRLISHPHSHRESAQMTFKVDVLPAGNWQGPEDMIQIGDIIFIDPSGKIINACTNEPISGVTVTLLKELEPNTGTFFPISGGVLISISRY